MMTHAEKIPATIITGFLGSGKTTLLRHLLQNAGGRRIAAIVNEFGELGIDGDILKGCGIGCDENGEATGQIFELNNGCLCCTVQEEFFPVIQALIARRDQIDHIIIETSGLALPRPLVQAFQWPEISNACTVDAVITLVDTPAVAAGLFAANPKAVDEQRRADPGLDHESPLHELFEDQLSAADLVILGKSDLVNSATLDKVAAIVRAEIPDQVKIVNGSHGQFDPALLLGMECRAEAFIHLRENHHDHDEDHDHDVFQSVSLALPEMHRDALQHTLQTLTEQHEIYRIKGFVAVQDKPMRLVIHAVGTRIDSYFDRPWRATEARQSQLVFIGRALDAQVLQNSLQAAMASNS